MSSPNTQSQHKANSVLFPYFLKKGSRFTKAALSGHSPAELHMIPTTNVPVQKPDISYPTGCSHSLDTSFFFFAVKTRYKKSPSVSSSLLVTAQWQTPRDNSSGKQAIFHMCQVSSIQFCNGVGSYKQCPKESYPTAGLDCNHMHYEKPAVANNHLHTDQA